MKTTSMPGFTAEASLYRSGDQYRNGRSPDGLSAGRGVVPQADNTIWTKDTICRACGCSVSGFTCNCGLNPNPNKVECIKNGGPGKAVAVAVAPTFTTGGGGVFHDGGVFHGGGAVFQGTKF